MTAPDDRSAASWVDLSAFQRDCLEVVARRERDDDPCDERGILRAFERSPRSVTRARLDPTLHVLVDHGLLEKRRLEALRYEYPLTDDGRALLSRRVDRLADACGLELPASGTTDDAPAARDREGERERT
ncbi:PadR family transcriptional regulator [Natrinema salaciae]|uniref:Transcriptional regulator PadR-like family protein n=1 Tax=Natrinema salaciae TaxID=1186196 RepID=A0A1H9M244_9EURY|nr:PadR family transcriptional regulator [Natrinema salaciae]SER17732.1 hypothetical protein SAMN04489841_3174 [Natrinema salaciae]